MPRGLVVGSLAHRIVAALGVAPATVGGLVEAVGSDSKTVGSSLVQLQNSGTVTVLYTVAEARERAMKFSCGPKLSREGDRVYGLTPRQWLRKSQENGRRGHANANLRGRIRELLEQRGEMTSPEIAEELGVDRQAVSWTLCEMVGRSGGVVMTGPRGHRIYTIYESAAVVAQQQSPHVAPPCRIGRGLRWFVEHV